MAVEERTPEALKWHAQKDLKCVILCGGKGTRLLPASLTRQKGMIKVRNKPIIRHIIDYWSRYTDDFIFVVKYRKEEIIEYIKGLSMKSSFVEPQELRGIADGVCQVRDLVANRFIVALGDCVCKGEFAFPPGMEQGAGVWRTGREEDIRRSYSVTIKGGVIDELVEKPKELRNDLCGMGFYFFDRKVFGYIERTRPSELRGEIEITDVIQNMIRGGEKVMPVQFRGEYLNITYMEDLKRARSIL